MEPFYHQFSSSFCSAQIGVVSRSSHEKRRRRRNIALNLERTATRGHPLVQCTFYVSHYVYIYYSILVMYTIIKPKKKPNELFFQFNRSNWCLTYTNSRTWTNLYLDSILFDIYHHDNSSKQILCEQLINPNSCSRFFPPPSRSTPSHLDLFFIHFLLLSSVCICPMTN